MAVTLLLVAALASPTEPAMPEHPDVEVAKSAYNGKRYNEASRRFLDLVQRWPDNAALYRALARSRSWAGDTAGSIVAYEFYLDLAPKASDREKVEAELELALKKVGERPPPGPPAEAAAMLEAAPTRANQGRFLGGEGAFGAIDAALEAGYLGPRLAIVRERVAQSLARQSDQAIDRWWQADAEVDGKTLTELDGAWAELGRRREVSADDRSHTSAIRGLMLLHEGQPGAAVAALAPVAPELAPLRFAQALALTRANRDDEALQVLDGLRGGLDDPRVDALYGLVLAKAGKKKDAVEALKAALQ